MSTPTTFNDLFDAFMDDLASRVAAKISSNGVVHPSSTNGTSTSRSTPSLSPPTLRVVSSMPKRPSDREEPWTQAELEALNKPALVAAADALGVPHGPKPRAKSLIRDILALEAEAAVAPNFAFVVDDDSEEDVEDEAVESEDVPEEKAIDLSEDTDDDDDDYWTQAELDDMSTAQLRQVALSFTIKGYDTLDRDELIEAILAE